MDEPRKISEQELAHRQAVVDRFWEAHLAEQQWRRANAERRTFNRGPDDADWNDITWAVVVSAGGSLSLASRPVSQEPVLSVFLQARKTGLGARSWVVRATVRLRLISSFPFMSALGIIIVC